MRTACLIFATICVVSRSVGFDLGPKIWIAQCQSACLRHFNQQEEFRQLTRKNTHKDFHECTRYCVLCHDEQGSKLCGQDDPLQLPRRFFKDRSLVGRDIACEYCRTRELTENYEPSMLPAPEDKPIELGSHDVALVFRRQHQRWEFHDFYYDQIPTGKMYPCHWVIVVTENGPRHHTWQRWVPSLDSLKEGPLFEATVSWRDVRQQLQLQRRLEEMDTTDDHLRHLELSSKKVLALIHRGSDDVLPRLQWLFWKQEDLGRYPKDCYRYHDDSYSNGNKSLVVTWGPETGGLTGNQVTDGDSAQISLLPGVRYHVRVASNDGPGSFPILVDTRPPATNDSSEPPSSPAPSVAVVCDFTCRARQFLLIRWQYVLLLFVIALFVLCYVRADAILMHKPAQTWEKAVESKDYTSQDGGSWRAPATQGSTSPSASSDRTDGHF